VLVVDTTRIRQLGIGQHHRKTDRIDAEVLARALERGGIPLAHVLSPARRELRRVLGVTGTAREASWMRSGRRVQDTWQAHTYGEVSWLLTDNQGDRVRAHHDCTATAGPVEADPGRRIRVQQACPGAGRGSRHEGIRA